MVIIISRFPSVCLWTVQAPMHTAMFTWLYAYEHTQRFEACYLPSVLPAGQMLYFSLACYINRVVVCARHTLCCWPLPSYPDRSAGHTTAKPNAIITDLILIAVSVSHFKSIHFHIQLLFTDDFSGEVASTVSAEKQLSCVPGIGAWINKQEFALIDVMSCLSPVADGSRWNKMQKAARWLTSDSDTSQGAFCFLKFSLNIKVGA